MEQMWQNRQAAAAASHIKSQGAYTMEQSSNELTIIGENTEKVHFEYILFAFIIF